MTTTPLRMQNAPTDAVSERVAKATLRPEDESAVLAESRANGCTCDYDAASCRHHGVLVENGQA